MPEALRADDPRLLGRYELIGRLGAGGQGVVYAARAPDGTTVAVKLLRTGFGADGEARGRFLRELDVAKRVRRFCTAAVLDADVTGDHPYIVSEYVAGPSLQEVVRANGPRHGGALERLAVGTATALVAIHRAGVVHRDFKPQNVLMGPDGPRVIDFGVARALDGVTVTSSGVVGTPAYMAPEQLDGERPGPAADVFSWAGTMVFASSGRLPFGDDSMAAVLNRILHGQPDLGALTGVLRDVVERCFAKDPADRPPAAEVLRVLLGEEEVRAETVRVGAAVAHEQGRPTDPAGVTTTLDRRPAHRVAGAVAVVSAVVAVAAAAAVIWALTHGPGGGTGSTGSPSPTHSGTTSQPPSGTPDVVFGNSYAGRWTGTVRQSDGKNIRVVLDLPKGKQRGTVQYPDQNCSGIETLDSKAGDTISLHERITQGAEHCVPKGALTLTRRGDGSLFFNYTGVSVSGKTTWTVSGPVTRG